MNEKKISSFPLAVTLVIIAIAANCNLTTGPDALTTADNSPVGRASIKMLAAANSPFSSLADSAVALVSAEDMITLSSVLTVTDTSVEGIIAGIPAGKDRTIEIHVYDSNSVLQYTGSGRADVVGDTTISVEISIVRVKGAVEVNGVIVDSTDPLFNGLVAYYPFSGNSRDYSGHYLDGTVYGAALTTDRNGRANSAYQFDGTNDYIEVGFTTLLDCEDRISVLLWAKSDIQGSDYTDYSTILQLGTGSEAAYSIGLNGNYDLNVVQFDFCSHWVTPASSSREDVDAATTNGAVRCSATLDTSWHFYAMTFDGDTLRGYYDGEMIGSKVALSGPVDNLPLRIGAQSKSLARYWKGKIDDIRIYHRAVSSEEIADIRNSDD